MKYFLFSLISIIPHVGWSQVKSLSYEFEDGEKYSSQIRTKESYIASMKIMRPKANQSPTALAKVNPHLPNLLKDFTKLIETSEVSSRYKELYDRKISLIKRGSYSTQHNFCDCETVLRLKHPETGRIALWVQADMDVVTDGSDPGRSPKIEDYDLARSSNWFLPGTSYSWARASTDPANPFLEYYPGAIKELQAFRETVVEKQKSDSGVIWREILDTVDSQIYRMKSRGMGSGTRKDLSARRFLEATKDPFVVLPVPWVNKSAAWSPQIGDYAAVIYKDKVFPAILGDSGPSDKVGEASLKIARGINPEANGRNRAVSDVTVSYIFFPRTASPRSAPDYALWRTKVGELLEDIGGMYHPEKLHSWE
ncbi:MAG: glycoside hydrolase family 75 protein [Verrucomicrobiales bacterium]|nr:glycoside hydrolase family 75 protein [Verrucomicrobiales bacterium]